MVGTPLEFETVLDVCEHKHRRIVLTALAEQHQSVPIADLTEAIVECTADETIAEIRTDLHHVHLPKLAEVGLVEYDPDRKLAESTARFDRGVPHLSAILGADSEITTPSNV